ncbi:unnamed protein product [Aphis gossypii]|uniref:Uncharacterized protein n=1 Tax=Aphis gossypii TaxID=80765 RepID=A0A9P0J8V7_APHGO|nr:unnamed protein product [Aphis gossypii]
MNNIDFINSLKNNSFNLTCNDETLIKGETSDFDKFVKDLLLLGYGFIVEKSVKYEGENSKYRFTLERGEIPIKFIGCPFLIKQHVYYKCVNGPHQKQKDNYSTNDHPTSTKKRFHLNSTKKYNCQAVMIMVKITYFPEYEITENLLSQWRVKKQVQTINVYS